MPPAGILTSPVSVRSLSTASPSRLIVKPSVPYQVGRPSTQTPPSTSDDANLVRRVVAPVDITPAPFPEVGQVFIERPVDGGRRQCIRLVEQPDGVGGGGRIDVGPFDRGGDVVDVPVGHGRQDGHTE